MDSQSTDRIAPRAGVYMTSMMILIGLLGSFEHAGAIPFLGKPCASSGYTNGMSNLIHNVAIMPNDQRYGILEGGPKFNLSSAEINWLRSITGQVICTNSVSKKRFQATGVIIGRDNQVLTNAHIFYRPEGKADFASCTFTSKTDPPVKRQILLESGGAKFGTEHPDKDEFQDYAIATLDKPIPGVVPLRIAKDISGIKNDSEIWMLSAQMARMRRSVGINEPIIQKCSARNVLGPDSDGGTVMYSDCSTAGGASGSINLVRGADGILEGVSVSTGGGKATKDDQPYSYENNNYAQSLGFDGQLKADLDRFGESNKPQ